MEKIIYIKNILNLLLKYILLRNQFYYNMDAINYVLLFSLVTNNLTWKKTF